MALIGLMIYCSGLVFGIIGAMWVDDLIENSKGFKDGSYRAD